MTGELAGYPTTLCICRVSAFLESIRDAGSSTKIFGLPIPHFHSRYCKLVCKTPNPYVTDLRKLIELASLKYFVGQEISPMRKLNATSWAII